MKNTLLILSSILFLSSGVFAQNNKSLNCPTVDVSGGGNIERGQLISFTANVIGAEDRLLEYIWTLSSGKIVNGQGTSSITVEPNWGEALTATVEVKGVPEGCSNLTDSEYSGYCSRRQPSLFDEYGPLPNSHIESRVQNLYVELGNNPGAQGYIISYGTDKEVARREKQIIAAISSLRLDETRFTLVRGGANPKGKGVWSRVWLVPAGADNPTPDM